MALSDLKQKLKGYDANKEGSIYTIIAKYHLDLASGAQEDTAYDTAIAKLEKVADNASELMVIYLSYGKDIDIPPNTKINHA
jgi:hypothetical protein